MTKAEKTLCRETTCVAGIFGVTRAGITQRGSLDKKYLDGSKTTITLAYMQLSLSFCSVQLRSHIGHMMVSFASQISLLEYETGK